MKHQCLQNEKCGSSSKTQPLCVSLLENCAALQPCFLPSSGVPHSRRRQKTQGCCQGGPPKAARQTVRLPKKTTQQKKKKRACTYLSTICAGFDLFAAIWGQLPHVNRDRRDNSHCRTSIPISPASRLPNVVFFRVHAVVDFDATFANARACKCLQPVCRCPAIQHRTDRLGCGESVLDDNGCQRNWCVHARLPFRHALEDLKSGAVDFLAFTKPPSATGAIVFVPCLGGAAWCRRKDECQGLPVPAIVAFVLLEERSEGDGAMDIN